MLVRIKLCSSYFRDNCDKFSLPRGGMVVAEGGWMLNFPQLQVMGVLRKIFGYYMLVMEENSWEIQWEQEK